MNMCNICLLYTSLGISQVPQLAIGVILQNKHPVLRGQFRHPLAAVVAQTDAGGVLERGNGIDELGMVGLDLPLQVCLLYTSNLVACVILHRDTIDGHGAGVF